MLMNKTTSGVKADKAYLSEVKFDKENYEYRDIRTC